PAGAAAGRVPGPAPGPGHRAHAPRARGLRGSHGDARRPFRGRDHAAPRHDRVPQPDSGDAHAGPCLDRPRQERRLRDRGRAHRLLLRDPLRTQRGRGGRGHDQGRGHVHRARGGGGRHRHPLPVRARAVTRAAEAQVEVRSLTMAYGDTVIQKDLSFAVARGEIFVIMGDSGGGKSTLLRHMIGLNRPASGEVLYQGEAFWAADEEERQALKQRFGVLYQSAALWSSMTLAENVALPLVDKRGLPVEEAGEVARLKLALVGLAGFEEHYPSEISGGVRTRGGLGRGAG